tara:strand:+ start:786 stop:1319 length:534 start_codon:yes stop_codon:yes gene_type:complete
MATLQSTGISFPDGSALTGAEHVVSCRYAYYNSTQGDPGNSGTWIGNLEVTMPATKSNNSRYLIFGESNTDDNNQSTCGAAVCTWVWSSQNNNSYWVHRPGAHSHYYNDGNDKYFVLHDMMIDDGNITGGITAGETRKYRLYSQSHNGNMTFQANVGGQEGVRAKLIVLELDGSLIT